MSNVEVLRASLLVLIKDDNFDIQKLKDILMPISDYTDNTLFKENISAIVAILTQDRDGNHKFTVDDLALLSKDIIGITSLVTSILLLIGAIPELKLQYNEGETEDLIFKLLAYIFLVIVPAKTEKPLSFEEKQAILNLAVLIYQMIKSSKVVQNIVAKISAWFKSKNFCKCMTTETNKTEVLEKHLPAIKLDLMHAMNNVRDKSEMQTEIKSLRNIVNDVQSKNIKKQSK